MRPNEELPGTIRTQLARHYHEFSNHKNYYVKQFPDTGKFNGLMRMAAPDNNYSCSLAMVKLSHRVQNKTPPPMDEMMSAIRFKQGFGADQLDLYNGLDQMGIECISHENSTVEFLAAKLQLNNSIFILSMQDADSTLKQLIEVQAGHYMAACAKDKKKFYFANPGYVDGKSALSSDMLKYLWYDLVMATREIMYGYMIEVPVTANR